MVQSVVAEKILPFLHCLLILPVLFFSKYSAISILLGIFFVNIIFKTAYYYNWPIIKGTILRQVSIFFFRLSSFTDLAINYNDQRNTKLSIGNKIILDSFNYNIISLALAVYLFSDYVAISSFLVMVIGDNAATLIGQKWGKYKINNSNKTLEGSLTMFVVTCIILYAMQVIYGKKLIPWPLVLIIGFVATIIEVAGSDNLKFDDSISITVLTGLLLQLYSL